MKESIAFGPKRVQRISYFIGEGKRPLIYLNLDCLFLQRLILQ